MTLSLIPAKLFHMFTDPDFEPNALLSAGMREPHGWINFYYLDDDDESNGISVYVHFELHPESATWEGAWGSNPYELTIVKMERVAQDSPLEADSVAGIPLCDLEDIADLKALVLAAVEPKPSTKD